MKKEILIINNTEELMEYAVDGIINLTQFKKVIFNTGINVIESIYARKIIAKKYLSSENDIHANNITCYYTLSCGSITANKIFCADDIVTDIIKANNIQAKRIISNYNDVEITSYNTIKGLKNQR